MIAVVADTAPLCYLVQIEYQNLLPALFTQVFIPISVWQELQDEKTPAVVRDWTEHMPSWMRVRKLESAPSDVLRDLHAGERDAIHLAYELRANLLLIDERAGARIAREQGFLVTGTLGVLLEAAQLGLILINDGLTRLAKTNFRCTSHLFDDVRELARNRGIPT